jgi:hypothetical protein
MRILRRHREKAAAAEAAEAAEAASTAQEQPIAAAPQIIVAFEKRTSVTGPEIEEGFFELLGAAGMVWEGVLHSALHPVHQAPEIIIGKINKANRV